MIRSQIDSKRLFPVLTTILIVLLLPGLAAGMSKGKKAPVLPDDLVKLVPADAHGLATSASPDALDAKLVALLADPEDPQAEIPSLAGFLQGLLPDCDACLATDQPMAVAMTMPIMMGGDDPLITLIVPWRGDEAQAAGLIEATDFNAMARSGDYLALSTDPYYEPPAEVSALVTDLPVRLLAGRLDLATLFETLRPLAEMGLGAMIMGASAAENAQGDPGDGALHPAQPKMSLAEAQALAEVARGVMDSARLLELTLDGPDENLVCSASLGVKPDTPLAPGPQPPLVDAVELTRLLPAHEPLVEVFNVNKTPLYAKLMDVYRLSMERELDQIEQPLDPAAKAWFAAYFDLLDMYFKPVALTGSFSEEGWRMQMAIKSETAAADLDQITELLDTMPDLGLGVTMTRQASPVPSIRAWQIDFDPDELAALAADSTGLPHTDPEELAIMTRMMSKFMPGFYATTVDDLLLMSFDRNHDTLLDVIEAAGKRRAAVDPRVARAAEKAGPACRAVALGDLGSMLDWIDTIVSEVSRDDASGLFSKGLKLPFVETISIDEDTYSMDLSVPETAVKTMIQEIRKLDE